MKKVFLDANIYFSAFRLKTGGSSAIIKLIKAKKLKCFATKTVLQEAEKNIRLKEPISVSIDFYGIVTGFRINIVQIDNNKAEDRYLSIINKKVSYVLEGARKAKADYLITLDKKTLLQRKDQKGQTPLQNRNSGVFVKGSNLKFLKSATLPKVLNVFHAGGGTDTAPRNNIFLCVLVY